MANGKFRLVAVLFCLAAGVWFFSGPILRAMGSPLVNDGPPVAADMIVVPAGDGLGNRLLKGAELAREGFAPAVLVCSGGSEYSHTETELAIEFGIQHGYSPGLFVPVRWMSNSTVEEARNAIRDLRGRGVHKVIVVTSLWHTARAGRIYRRLAPDIEIHMVGAADPNWHNGDWWKDREGRKIFFLEWVKTIADFLRI